MTTLVLCYQLDVDHTERNSWQFMSICAAEAIRDRCEAAFPDAQIRASRLVLSVAQQKIKNGVAGQRSVSCSRELEKRRTASFDASANAPDGKIN